MAKSYHNESLDEAISRLMEEATGIKFSQGNDSEIKRGMECLKLAKWLKELREYRNGLRGRTYFDAPSL